MEVTLPWELAAMAVFGFILSALGLLWAYGNYPWDGENNAYTVKALGFMLAAMAMGGLATKVPFVHLMSHAHGVLLALAGFVIINLLVNLHIRSDGQWIFLLSQSGVQQQMQAAIYMLSPLIFISVLSHCMEMNPKHALLATTAFLSLACGCLSFMAGSMETAMISVLTILTMAWLAGMSNLLAFCTSLWVCLLGAGMILTTRPQLTSATSAENWSPVAVCSGAFAQGGNLGVGLGAGLFPENTPKSFYDDFLFSITGYELGCVGALIIIALFTLFGLSGFRLARQTGNPYARLCVAGTTLSFLMPALAHFGSCTATLPPGRNWLPFFTGGGAPLLACWGALGFIAAAIQYDVCAMPVHNPLHHRMKSRSILWRPARAKILKIAFIVSITVLTFRVILLAGDSDTRRRFKDYIDQTTPSFENPIPLYPRWNSPRLDPPLEEWDATPTYQETMFNNMRTRDPISNPLKNPETHPKAECFGKT